MADGLPVFPERNPPDRDKSPIEGTKFSEEVKNAATLRAVALCEKFKKEKELEKDGKPSQMAAEMRMLERKEIADFFCAAYKYDNNNREEAKYCVTQHGFFHWLENKLSGVTWVGVHGENSICVVTLADNLDMTRVSGSAGEWRKHDILCDFRRSAIHKIEVLPNPSSKDWTNDLKKPFGVVCVNRETNNQGYDEHKAIQFLQEEFMNAVKSTTTFSTDKTVQTAISALQHMCKKVFQKANEIEVSLMDPTYEIRDHEIPYKDLTIEELELPRIKKYLVAVNDPKFKGIDVTIDEVDQWCIENKLSIIDMRPLKKPRLN